MGHHLQQNNVRPFKMPKYSVFSPNLSRLPNCLNKFFFPKSGCHILTKCPHEENEENPPRIWYCLNVTDPLINPLIFISLRYREKVTITKSSFLEIQSVIMNHESRPVKSGSQPITRIALFHIFNTKIVWGQPFLW